MALMVRPVSPSVGFISVFGAVDSGVGIYVCIFCLTLFFLFLLLSRRARFFDCLRKNAARRFAQPLSNRDAKAVFGAYNFLTSLVTRPFKEGEPSERAEVEGFARCCEAFKLVLFEQKDG